MSMELSSYYSSYDCYDQQLMNMEEEPLIMYQGELAKQGDDFNEGGGAQYHDHLHLHQELDHHQYNYSDPFDPLDHHDYGFLQQYYCYSSHDHDQLQLSNNNNISLLYPPQHSYTYNTSATTSTTSTNLHVPYSFVPPPFDQPLFSEEEILMNNYMNIPMPMPIPMEANFSCKRHKLIDGDDGGRGRRHSDHQGKMLSSSSSSTSSGAVSAQSIAARERRRKITEKTQELGKLVPGATKMNTAEMLQAAFNYVKFLQAQLHLLQSNLQLDENAASSKGMENTMAIVANPKVQEKLYMEERCIAPMDFVLRLTKLSKPPLSHQLTRLLPFPPNQ